MTLIHTKRVFAVCLLVFLCTTPIARAEDVVISDDATQDQPTDSTTTTDQSTPTPAAPAPEALVDGSSSLDISKLVDASIPFLQNIGQIDSSDVSFYTDTFAGRIFVVPHGLRYAFQMADVPMPTSMVPEKQSDGTLIDPLEEYAKHIFTQVVDESFVGGNATTASGSGQTDTKVSSFIGNNEDAWQHDIPAFEQVDSGEVWPGIHVSCHARGNNLEKVFTIAPNTDPNQIQVKVDGATIAKDQQGRLILQTPKGDASLTKPIAYQDIDGERKDIQVSYKLLADNTYTFTLGDYNADYPLVVDPLLGGTYIGGVTALDQAYESVQDSEGNIFLSGITALGTDFPATTGAYDRSFNGGVIDGFVAKFSEDFSQLLAATYYGGVGNESTTVPIAVDADDNVYIANSTGSADFPVTGGAYDTTYNGGGDAFIIKFDNELQNLLASTVYGGAAGDAFKDIQIEAGGTVLVAGYGGDSPTVLGGYDTSFNGGLDLIVARFSNDLSTLLAATFIGSTSTEHISSTNGLAVDSSGNIYITAGSNGSDYPVTGGAYDESFNGSWDIVVSKLTSDLTTLLASTYIGGSGDDDAVPFESVLVSSSGVVYVASVTNSSDFPTTLGAYDTSANGAQDIVLTKLNSALTTLSYSTYFGGTGSDFIEGFAISSSGSILMSGETGSTGFPITSGAYLTSISSGVSSGFITKFASDYTLQASTYFTSSSYSTIAHVYEDTTGNYLISGFGPGNSIIFPSPSYGLSQPISSGNNQGFLARITPSLLFNDPPIGTFAAAIQSPGSSKVSARVSVYDIDRNTTSLTLEYSQDNVSWHNASIFQASTDEGQVTWNNNVVSDIDTSFDRSVNLTLSWDAGTDLPNTTDDSVYLRFRTNDGTQNSASYATSPAFSLHTTAASASGGGSGGTPPPTNVNPLPPTTPTPETPPTQPTSLDSGSNPTPQGSNPTGSTSPTINSPVPPTFRRPLSYGKRGADVFNLQQYLNDLGFTVSTTGPGSPGHETTFFGPKTKQALIRFQKAHGIKPTGVVDGETKGELEG